MSGNILHLFGLLFLFCILLLTDVKLVFCGILSNIILLIFIRNLHGLGLSHENWVSDELRIMVHHFGKLAKVSVLLSIILEFKSNLSTTSKRISTRIFSDGVRIFSILTRPNILYIRLGVLGSNGYLIRYKEGRVESNSKHTNLRNISSTLLELIHELGGTTSGHSTKTRDEVFLGHTNSRIGNGESSRLCIVCDSNFQLGFILQEFRLGNRQETDFVESIGCIGDEFTEEDVFVLVEGVDNNVQDARYLRLEFECFACTFSYGIGCSSSLCGNRIICECKV